MKVITVPDNQFVMQRPLFIDCHFFDLINQSVHKCFQFVLAWSCFWFTKSIFKSHTLNKAMLLDYYILLFLPYNCSCYYFHKFTMFLTLQQHLLHEESTRTHFLYTFGQTFYEHVTEYCAYDNKIYDIGKKYINFMVVVRRLTWRWHGEHMMTWNLTKQMTRPQKPRSPNDPSHFRP